MAYESGVLLKSGSNEMEIVEFYLDEARAGDSGDEVFRVSYGINVAKVLEIISKPPINKIPMSHPSVIGTFSLRKKVIPLVDLVVQLGKRKPGGDGNPLAIITEFNKITMAFEVSGVNRIHRLAWSEIEPAEAVLGHFAASVTGIVKFEDRNVLILDLEKILAELNASYCLESLGDALQNATLPVGREGLAELEPPGGAQPLKVLLADDSSSIRALLCRRLEREGFKVTSVYDGEKALAILMELKKRSREENRPIFDYIEILISDIEMPVMDGYSLCSAVKKDPVLGFLPVILFSSLINDRQLHKGKSVGADEQIAKPEAANLAESARRLIAQSKARMEEAVSGSPPSP